ncbi:MAG: recombinase family protein [Candidatus Acidiferrales bacterium]
MKRAFAYIRVSSKGQVDGDGFERQSQAIKSYATQHNIRIVKWFREEGVSGTREHREALDAMLVELMSDGVQTVIIEKLDRLSRDLRIQENLIHEYFTGRFELLSTCEPDLGSNDPTRVLIRQILGGLAQYDKSNIVLKLRAARQRMREKTGRCEGRKAFGSTPEEQETLGRMRSLAKQGMTYSAIAIQLNKEKRPTQTGSVWFPTTVSRTLIRES